MGPSKPSKKTAGSCSRLRRIGLVESILSPRGSRPGPASRPGSDPRQAKMKLGGAMMPPGGGWPRRLGVGPQRVVVADAFGEAQDGHPGGVLVVDAARRSSVPISARMLASISSVNLPLASSVEILTARVPRSRLLIDIFVLGFASLGGSSHDRGQRASWSVEPGFVEQGDDGLGLQVVLQRLGSASRGPSPTAGSRRRASRCRLRGGR